MKYTLTEVTEIPEDGRASRVPVGFYEDIIKVFLELGYAKAEVGVPGRNPDTIHRRLLIHAPHGVSALCRKGGVYLQNDALVIENENNS